MCLAFCFILFYVWVSLPLLCLEHQRFPLEDLSHLHWLSPTQIDPDAAADVFLYPCSCEMGGDSSCRLDRTMGILLARVCLKIYASMTAASSWVFEGFSLCTFTDTQRWPCPCSTTPDTAQGGGWQWWLLLSGSSLLPFPVLCCLDSTILVTVPPDPLSSDSPHNSFSAGISEQTYARYSFWLTIKTKVTIKLKSSYLPSLNLIIWKIICLVNLNFIFFLTIVYDNQNLFLGTFQKPRAWPLTGNNGKNHKQKRRSREKQMEERSDKCQIHKIH